MIFSRALPCRTIHRDSPEFPNRVRLALGAETPDSLALFGNADLLELPYIALFSSLWTPPELVLRAIHLARCLRAASLPIAGGFQAPLERELLHLLLRGEQPITICPARGIEGMRLPAPWRPALRAERLLVLSPFPPHRRRPTLGLAGVRNRLVAGLADRIFVVHARPGSRAFRVAAAGLAWGKPVYCFDHIRNSDLILLGAKPIDTAGLISGDA